MRHLAVGESAGSDAADTLTLPVASLDQQEGVCPASPVISVHTAHLASPAKEVGACDQTTSQLQSATGGPRTGLSVLALSGSSVALSQLSSSNVSNAGRTQKPSSAERACPPANALGGSPGGIALQDVSRQRLQQSPKSAAARCPAPPCATKTRAAPASKGAAREGQPTQAQATPLCPLSVAACWSGTDSPEAASIARHLSEVASDGGDSRRGTRGRPCVHSCASPAPCRLPRGALSASAG